jgi:hypothetical protein
VASKPRIAFWIRIAILLSVLAVVTLYAFHDISSRRERTSWERTLDVALVLVEDGQVADDAVAALRARVPVLEQRLKEEYQRYRPGAPAPFAFVTFGPVPLATRAPGALSEGFVGLARHALEVFRFTRDVDARAAVPARAFDARLYLVLRPPSNAQQAFVEGASEQGGRIGIASCDLADDMADFALFVAAHELFHTLSATDKYDAGGHTLVPEGLAEPERAPRFPQQYAELMARNRPLDAQSEAPPTALSELRVGPYTAQEIGWSARAAAAPGTESR